ncbi:flavodoxin [Rhodococcus erythropolis]|jgi:flavodoxin|uniref:Flavodoxin n=1 Tax=Rhodococcus erythropolis TaxID=1833 RepID=A0A5P3G4W0_RHOER|nr:MULTISPECIES: flavodoxin family protein [Rhodococcus]ERB54370.1 flavodoxin [Rhodococcus sp. P27]EQM30428.1 flavodoxin [Rhodococcus erythropolis DN1]MCJ0947336.1 flavodoxin family protein [Rhodococcus sp. ARC_M8]MCW2299723.1 flavodoxin [Rhodococcus erythropolis]QEX09841.1 flavodoxin [Rhodococcus erythropolis]
MKAIIVCTSVSHGNTKRIADVIGEVLDARVVEPGDIDAAQLADYDLVGFGSGIYLRSYHEDLRSFVEALPEERRSKAFVFATSGFPDKGIHRFSRPLVQLLEQKGFDVVAAFSSRAWDTYFPFKPFGGIRKGRPNADDLESARTFAEVLRGSVQDSLPGTG